MIDQQFLHQIEQSIQAAVNVQHILAQMPNRRHADVIEMLLLRGLSVSQLAQMWHTTEAEIEQMKENAIKEFLEYE